MKISIPRIIFCTLVFLVHTSRAQQAPAWSLGASIGAVAGVNESTQQSLNAQFHFTCLWLNGIMPRWSVEASIGTAKIGSSAQGHFSEYSTSLVPIDLRVRFAPLENMEWQPYLYAGIGLLHYTVNSAPPNSSSNATLSGTSAYLPLGIGLSHPIDEEWTAEATIAENPTFTDDLNPVRDNRNDAFWGFTIGVRYTFGIKSSSSDDFDFGTRGTVRIVRDIVFDSGRAWLKPESERILQRVMSSLDNHPDIDIEIRVYSDDSGDFNTNMALTQERAESVKVWLVSRGVPAARISTQGYGPHNPLVPNTSAQNMETNRRVEIVRMQ
ncbi:MAG: OmpA family protein [Bacteroidota bacterium]|nr:OmpA family protein [Bacteroidota bacterium]MDP4229190.1 OmpA family protein [Bacteroidota bacterium]MDP4236710.1 OmpA family protein [Bacteroidota bacterium]